MTANLSFPDHHRLSRGIEHFYSDLHVAMYDLGDIDGAPFPSAREFKDHLARRYGSDLSGLRCLDAGCGGTAINARAMAAACGRVSAVDLNQRSLDVARRSVSGAGRPIAFACASLLDLPFDSATFDFAVCSGVVHHTPDPERALRELGRVMKPGARVYVSAYCFEGSLMHALVRVWRRVARVVPFSLMHGLFKRSTIVNNFVLDHMYVPILWVYHAADFSRMLERCGFIVEQTSVSALDRFHGRRLGMWSVTGDGLVRVFLCSTRDGGGSR